MGSINQPAGLGKTPSPARSDPSVMHNVTHITPAIAALFLQVVVGSADKAPSAYLFAASRCDQLGAQRDPDPGAEGAPISDAGRTTGARGAWPYSCTYRLCNAST